MVLAMGILIYTVLSSSSVPLEASEHSHPDLMSITKSSYTSRRYNL